MGKMIEIDTGLFDILIRRRLHSEQVRVLLVVMSRPDDVLTLADFNRATGISKPHVCRSIKALAGAGLLSVMCEPDGKRRYLIPGFTVNPVQPENALSPSATMPGQDTIDGTPAHAMTGNASTDGNSGISIQGKGIPSMDKPVAISGNVPLFGNDAISANGNIPAIGGLAVLIGGQWVSFGGDTIATPGAGIDTHARNIAAVCCLDKKQSAEKAAWESAFGAKLPPGADMNAIHVMLSRKESGKLADIKNPVGYLLAMGKVPMPKNDQVVKPGATVESETRIISDAEYKRQLSILDAWDKLSDDDRKPYYAKAEQMKLKAGKIKFSLDFLAQRSFIWDRQAAVGNC